MQKLTKIEDAGVDLSEFEGQRVKIASIEQLEVSSGFSDRGKQWVLKVSSQPVTELETSDGKKDICASELFNLKENQHKQPVGWSSKGNLQKLLDKLKIDDVEELADREVIIKLNEKARDDGTKTQFLGFIY